MSEDGNIFKAAWENFDEDAPCGCPTCQAMDWLKDIGFTHEEILDLIRDQGDDDDTTSD